MGLDILVDGAMGLFFGKRRRGPIVPGRERAIPTEKVLRATRIVEQAYVTWASKMSFRQDLDARGYRGRLSGCEVLVRPGLEGSAPIMVEVEIAIEHEETEAFLVATPEDPKSKTDLNEVLYALLVENAVDVRTIAIIPSGIRMRFMKTTLPALVQDGVEAVISVMHERRRALAHCEPYR